MLADGERRHDEHAGAPLERELDGAATELWASGCEPGDGGASELGEGRVAFGEIIIDHEGLFIGADDAAAFEVTEDASAGDLKRIGHVGGRNVRKRVEGRAPIRCGGVHAIQEDDVQVRTELQVGRRALHDDHGAALGALGFPVAPLTHRIGSRVTTEVPLAVPRSSMRSSPPGVSFTTAKRARGRRLFTSRSVPCTSWEECSWCTNCVFDEGAKTWNRARGVCQWAASHSHRDGTLPALRPGGTSCHALPSTAPGGLRSAHRASRGHGFSISAKRIRDALRSRHEQPILRRCSPSSLESVLCRWMTAG